MKMHNMDIAKRNMLMTSELIKVMKLLEENDIEAISFKGPLLSQMAYGDITLRQYVDLDILVGEEDLEKAFELLENTSYKKVHELQEYQTEKLKNIVHDASFIHTKNNVLVECHWVLSSGEFYIDINQWNDLAKPTYHKLQNTKIATLSNEKLLVYLCIHGYKHMWERLEWLVDIVKLNESNSINWKEVLELSNNVNAERVVLSSLYLCHKILGMHLTKDTSTLLEQNKKLKIITEKMLGNLKKSYALPEAKQHSKQISSIQFYMLKTTKSRFAYLKTLVSPTENDYKIIKLPKYLSFLYFFIRPFNVLIK